MSGTQVREAFALLAGCLACVGIILVIPFCGYLSQVWQGPTTIDPSGLRRLPELLAFGLPLGACIVLATGSLAFRADRPGAGAPAVVALTLIGLQLLVFVPMAAWNSR